MTYDAFTHQTKFADEAALLHRLKAEARLSPTDRARISHDAARLVRDIRSGSAPTMMEHFLSEYGLSTREGIALMCLAEALLRVPDAGTIDALIEDKIVPSDWSRHLGEAASPLVNASTWALMLTGRVLEDEQPGLAGTLRGAIKRLGEPVIRAAVGRAMREMGRQFVLGETIEKALGRAGVQERKGYTYSYDMLGEAAMTAADADRYFAEYQAAIAAIAGRCHHADVARNPGISIKLSALHPRYEVAQDERVLNELVPRVTTLARAARAAGMGLNIDAEEQDRLVLSLKVIKAVLEDTALAGWDGFGVVVQAYGKRAGAVIDWLGNEAEQADRRLMVRLVKGAYWDSEIKHAQVEGHADYPVFTSKAATDVSYISVARKLLAHPHLYPQFATHNAHTVAAILHMAGDRAFEFQRLHGMGERLHDLIVAQGARCRIYAPVGAHRDLLAYLVRRLLENGANSSFVNQIVDTKVPPEAVARDPFDAQPGALPKPRDLFGATRRNSTGFDLSDDVTLAAIEAARATGPAGPPPSLSPDQALASAQPWRAPVALRAQVLRRAADLYEHHQGQIFATLAREAGKTLPDCVGELREAVDFLRYYASCAEARDPNALGTVTAISPWNFPLAIFTGQIAAALACGNAVLAKPAEQTPRIAGLAVSLLHQAGVPTSALQLVPGDGSVGADLTGDPRVDGVVFTGSTETAHKIRQTMADHLDPGAPLVAETGGLNAMIIDSTALPEQAVRDVIASAFQSAGQRCSALRCLYVQDDVYDRILPMITGAMDALTMGDPWHLSTDVGPVIDEEAARTIRAHIESHAILHQTPLPHAVAGDPRFVPPTLIRVAGMQALTREVFGPVLHIATFAAQDLDAVIDAINATGYGLTFGLHTRIDSRVEQVARAVQAGNIYVNRNQIGAVVGSQPFGGDGLSGTGPKAGGPRYLDRFCRGDAEGREMSKASLSLPGPTGEANTWSVCPREPVLCIGPGADKADAQGRAVEALGGSARMAIDATPDQVAQAEGISGVVYWGDAARPYAQALARRPGPILPLITGTPDRSHATREVHLCVDTTAAGGNTTLLSGDDAGAAPLAHDVA